MVDVALAGTGGMMPLPNRFLTALVVRHNGRCLLIDCGEGTQITLKLLGFGFKNIDVICITHFHADHISGIVGLLLTLGNSNRVEPITIIGPPGLTHVVKSLLVIAPELPYGIVFHELMPDNNPVIKINDFCISAIPVAHRLTCYGYSVEFKRQGQFNPIKAEELGIPKKFWSLLQKGENVEFDGNIFTSDMVLGAERKGIKISYVTDTRPTATLPEFVKDSTLFVCEGIYGEDDKKDKALKNMHMLFSEAATIAKAGKVKELWLTHFSPALTEPGEFLHVARGIFPNTAETFDRKTVSLRFED